jgi:hypothetical protein
VTQKRKLEAKPHPHNLTASAIVIAVLVCVKLPSVWMKRTSLLLAPLSCPDHFTPAPTAEVLAINAQIGRPHRPIIYWATNLHLQHTDVQSITV